MSVQYLAKEPRGRPAVTPCLHQDVEDVAVLVHGPPQVLSLTAERDEDFIQIPGVAQPTSTAPQLSCVVETERLTPVADGFVRNETPRWASRSSTSRKLRQNR